MDICDDRACWTHGLTRALIVYPTWAHELMHDKDWEVHI